MKYVRTILCDELMNHLSPTARSCNYFIGEIARESMFRQHLVTSMIPGLSDVHVVARGCGFK